MSFFKGLDGSLYPVSQIRRVGKARLALGLSEEESVRIHIVYLESGEMVEIDILVFERLQSPPPQLIPAQPDTYLLSPPKEPGGDGHRTPVIAWAATPNLLMRPVTLNYSNDLMAPDHPILLPNGMVTLPGGRSYKTLDDWQAHQRATFGKEST